MSFTIIILNRIDTLRRLTAQSLLNLGYSKIKTASNSKQAEDIIFNLNDSILIIIELGPFGAHQEEIKFIKQLRKLQLYKRIELIITSEVIDKLVYERFSKLGAKEFIQQTFNFEAYTEKLEQSIQAVMQ